MNTPERIIYLREQKGWNQRELANRSGINVSVLNRIETGKRPLNESEIKLLANLLDVSIDYLINGEEHDKHYYDLTEKDERDIAKELEKILSGMDSDTNLKFDGEPMDETTKELVRAQLESNLRFAKEMAKKKFTPKKFRNE